MKIEFPQVVIRRFIQNLANQRGNDYSTGDLPDGKNFSNAFVELHFNLAHILSTGAMHGLQGYRELIETVAWGLEQLGSDVTTTENILRENCINIIFGAQVLPLQQIDKLPANSIIYNLEQMAGLDLSGNPVARAIAARFQIWDYSESNLVSWQRLNPTYPPIHVPVGWAPVLNRIPKPIDQDIDVLIYGKPGPLRLQIFNDLCQRGLKCLFICGLYGHSRDELISRAKLILNINLYAHSRIFEIVRVSYLLANAKAVVADILPDASIDPDVREAAAFAMPEEIVDTCLQLLKEDALREKLERKGKQIMEQRHIVPILQNVLAQTRLAFATLNRP